MEPPVFKRVGAWNQADVLMYHIGRPAEGDGYLLYFYVSTRSFMMTKVGFNGAHMTSKATDDELAQAIALLPPEEVARCTSASIKSAGCA